MLATIAVACGGPSVDGRIAAVTDDPSVASPLNALLGADGATADADARAESALVACMANAGFEYVAPGSGASAGASNATDEPDLDEVQRRGYGVADQLAAALAAATGAPDPNEAIRAALPDEQRAAYDEAITGLSPTEVVFDPERGIPLDPVTGSTIDRDTFLAASADGCLTTAYATVDTLPAAVVAFLTGPDYASLQAAIRADPDMLALQSGWQTCMADRGYAYQVTEQILDDLGDRASDIEHEATADHHDVSPEQTEAAIETLRRDEIAVAVADWDCSADLRAEAPAIVRRHEVDFLTQREDQMVALLDEVGR